MGVTGLADSKSVHWNLNPNSRGRLRLLNSKEKAKKYYKGSIKGQPQRVRKKVQTGPDALSAVEMADSPLRHVGLGLFTPSNGIHLYIYLFSLPFSE